MTDAAGHRPQKRDFIRQIVAEDTTSGRYDGEVVTRFPPEPNGYLHMGHAKSICLNFGIAQEFGGRCHLRFDDTNPETEEEEYVRAIRADVRWLGFDWGDHLHHASDYFERMYEAAMVLIGKGLAYVDSSSPEEIREARGTVTEPGRPTAYRDRSPEENRKLFRRMRDGEFENGAHVLRAKIDLASPNMIMRDPVLYRIRHEEHYRTGDEWCIYPLYDFAHCLEDAFEGITHSLCTLEFENNREIYDWVLDHVGFDEPRTHQYEFNRLNVEYTVLSKRRLIRLVQEGHVAGWDDPRMPTIAGLRRRGVPPEAVRAFCDMTGVGKNNSREDLGKLEYAIRDTLNPVAPRAMAVADPLKVVLTDYPQEHVEWLEAPLYPRDVPLEGTREVPFGRELWIEREDFAENPPAGFRRLVPGEEVRLRYGYVIRCHDIVKDEEGRVVELHCSHDPETRGGDVPDGRAVRGTIHWVAAAEARPATFRLYDRLFSVPDPSGAAADDEDVDFLDHLNPESLVETSGWVEPWVDETEPSVRLQFERLGYFWRDPVDGRPGTSDDAEAPRVFNRIVPLKDTWAARRRAVEEKEARAARAAAEAERRRKQEAGPTTPEERIADARKEARATDDELATRFERYQSEHGLSLEEADVLTASRTVSDFFEEALEAHPAPGAVAPWLVNDLRGLLPSDADSVADLPFDGSSLGELVALVEADRVSRRAAKDVLAAMVDEGTDPATLVAEMGLEKVSDSDALGPAVDGVLAEWPEKVAEYRDGRSALLGMFVGQVMRATGGAADPKAVKNLLRARLDDPKEHP